MLAHEMQELHGVLPQLAAVLAGLLDSNLLVSSETLVGAEHLLPRGVVVVITSAARIEKLPVIIRGVRIGAENAIGHSGVQVARIWIYQWMLLPIDGLGSSQAARSVRSKELDQDFAAQIERQQPPAGFTLKAQPADAVGSGRRLCKS